MLFVLSHLCRVTKSSLGGEVLKGHDASQTRFKPLDKEGRREARGVLYVMFQMCCL